MAEDMYDPKKLSEILDKGIETIEATDLQDKNLVVCYNLSIFSNDVEDHGESLLMKEHQDANKICVKKIADADKNFLTHPLVETYLHMKWNCIRPVF